MKNLVFTLLLASTMLAPPLIHAQQHQPAATPAPYPNWRHTGTLMLLTTPEGANLPAVATVDEFPVLVRLHKDWFDFKQAMPKGEDLRFSDSSGAALAYQVEEWAAAAATASVWVRIPNIKGQRPPSHSHALGQDRCSQ